MFQNFNHERWSSATGACCLARVCVEESFTYANKRKTFGKLLIEHPVIREKLGNMIRQVETTWAQLESITYQMNTMSFAEAQKLLGGPIALIKAHAGIVMEHCAREAAQIFGGLAYTRGGQGDKVERIYRDVLAYKSKTIHSSTIHSHFNAFSNYFINTNHVSLFLFVFSFSQFPLVHRQGQLPILLYVFCFSILLNCFLTFLLFLFRFL